MTRTFLTLAAVLLAAPAPADELDRQRYDNWHQWRGPEANGTAPQANPPVTWDADTNIKWKVPLPSKGSATPIVWGDQVFVVTGTKTDRVAKPEDLPKPDPRFETRTKPPDHFYRFEVHSFDRNTGKLRWRHTATEQVPHEGVQPTHSYAAGSPTTDGKFLYVSFGSWGIYCYDLDGKLHWQRDLGKLHTRLAWGEAVTPVVHGDSLLLNWDQEADSALICLDARTGQTKWRTPRDEHSTWTTPLVVEHGGQTQVILNGQNRIRAYDLATGKELWQCGGMTANPIPTPVTANGVVYCVSGYRGTAARAIRLGGKGDLTDSDSVRWRHDLGTPYVPSPLLVGDRLYFTQANVNLLTVLDTKTGKPVIDRARLPNVSGVYASPVAAAGRVYLTDRDGTTLVLKQGDKLEVLATNRLGDPIDASPAAVGKQLFLRGEKYLYCIEAP